MIPDECTFFSVLPSYEPCYFISCHYLSRYTVYLLQLLLLNFGGDGKMVGGLLVQKKTSMLFDGNNSNSCCNLENIRYVRFLLGNAVCSRQYLYEHFKNRKSMHGTLEQYWSWNSCCDLLQLLHASFIHWKLFVNCMQWCGICWNKHDLLFPFIINVFLILFEGARAAPMCWRDCVLLYISQAWYGGLSINCFPFFHVLFLSFILIPFV